MTQIFNVTLPNWKFCLTIERQMRILPVVNCSTRFSNRLDHPRTEYFWLILAVPKRLKAGSEMKGGFTDTRAELKFHLESVVQ